MPAVLVIFMRRLIEESDVFRQVRAIEDATGTKPGLFAIFQPAILRTTILSAFLALGVIGAGSAINPWLPSLLKTVHHLSVGRVGLYMAVATIGAFFGFIGGVYLTDRLGRRPNLLLFAICSRLLTPAYMYLPLSNTALLFPGLPFGFFTVGIYGSLGPYFAELFPTFVRDSGQTFAYNFGKSFGALSVAAVGLIAIHMPLGASIGLVSLWPGFESPFCALTMTVDFNDGGINHSVFHVRFLRNRIKNPLENISSAPVIEPAAGRAPVAKRGW
jgi:MFS family permease